MFKDGDFDDALLFELLKAIIDLVLIGDQQRPAAAKSDMHLSGGKTASPFLDQAADGAGDAAAPEYQVGNNRSAIIIRHVKNRIILPLRCQILSLLPFAVRPIHRAMPTRSWRIVTFPACGPV